MNFIPTETYSLPRKYIIGGVILYLPLLISNIMLVISMNSMNQLINTPENIDYINKIKYLINDACKVIDCSGN